METIMDNSASALPPVQGRAGGVDAEPEMASSGHSREAAAAEEPEPIDDETQSCPLPRSGWNGARIARLAYLIGTGMPVAEISFDPIVRATPQAIYKMASRLNIRLREVPNIIVVRLDDVEYAALIAEAAARRTGAGELAASVLKTCIADKLFGAVIDDR